MLVLRLVHIVAGIFWGGAALSMELFIRPSIDATGEVGQQFSRHLTNTIRIHIFMMGAAMATVLPGIVLYWIDSDGFTSAWLKSGAGIGFGIGAVFALFAVVFGAIFGRSNARLGKIFAQIRERPTPEQLTQLQALRKRMNIVSPFHVVTMILAMIFMATARYFTF